MKKKIEKIKGAAYHYGVQLVAVGALTGLFAGTVVTLYTALAALSEDFARGVYAAIRSNPAFIPLLFLALAAGAVVVGGVVKAIPMIRGSGIPQTEGATRGLFGFRWLRVLTGMFATSLFCIFMGLSAGSEGPSIQIGGACGYGTSELLRRNATVRRYQITGGACTGLAVAFNAPLTGMAFAFEEAHKRFTPEVFVCAFSSVIVGVLTRNLLRPLMGLSTGAFLTTFGFATPQPTDYLYILFAAALCGLAGVGFYFAVLGAKKCFGKIGFLKKTGVMLVPFLLGGACALVTPNVMGGGHELISALGSFGAGVESVFSSPVWVTLLIVLVLKFLLTVVNMGAGVPCGAFIPMLAVGACLGALVSRVCMSFGMDSVHCDLLILICMATFFTTVVKAPITGVVMVVELTWDFTFLLPVILGVAVGYLTGDLFRTEPIYEKLLKDFLVERPASVKRFTVRLRVGERSLGNGRAIRDVLWPADSLVVEVARGARRIVPDGETVLRAGDVILVRGEREDGKAFADLLASTVGEALEVTEETDPQESAER